MIAQGTPRKQRPQGNSLVRSERMLRPCPTIVERINRSYGATLTDPGFFCRWTRSIERGDDVVALDVIFQM